MASKKKGLTADQKRSRMLELFSESNEFFQMKELEKIAPKKKGIVSLSIKEVTQLLVDEGLVECEKIATFVCYWAFPTQAAIKRNKKLQELDEKISHFEARLEEVNNDVLKAKKGKERVVESDRLRSRINDLHAEHEALTKKLGKLSEDGPEAMSVLENAITKTRDEANRWTDNIFAAKRWCKNNFNAEEKVFNAQFEIPPELVYLE